MGYQERTRVNHVEGTIGFIADVDPVAGNRSAMTRVNAFDLSDDLVRSGIDNVNIVARSIRLNDSDRGRPRCGGKRKGDRDGQDSALHRQPPDAPTLHQPVHRI